MRDSGTKRSRGFGFVSFSCQAEVDNAMKARPHTIDGKAVDPKRAVPRDQSQKSEQNMSTRRLYVSGVRDEHTEDVFTKYFSDFGQVNKVEIITDKNTQKTRGFAFITFEDYDSVDKCVLLKSHMINGYRCDVKKALSRDEMQKAQQKERDRAERGVRSRGSPQRGKNQRNPQRGGGSYGGRSGGGGGGYGGGGYGGGGYGGGGYGGPPPPAWGPPPMGAPSWGGAYGGYGGAYGQPASAPWQGAPAQGAPPPPSQAAEQGQWAAQGAAGGYGAEWAAQGAAAGGYGAATMGAPSWGGAAAGTGGTGAQTGATAATQEYGTWPPQGPQGVPPPPQQAWGAAGAGRY